MINWIQTNWDNILAVMGGVIALASTVVKLTPTTQDDAVLGKIVSFLNYFSVFNPKADQAILDKTHDA